MHGNESVCLQNVYDKALDDGPMLFDNIMHSTVESDQSSCFKFRVVLLLVLGLLK